MSDWQTLFAFAGWFWIGLTVGRAWQRHFHRDHVTASTRVAVQMQEHMAKAKFAPGAQLTTRLTDHAGRRFEIVSHAHPTTTDRRK